MSPQRETNTAPKMKLAVLMIFVLLAAVNGAPNIDHDYQDSLSNQLSDYESKHTKTANHLEGLEDTYTESVRHDEDEWTENSQHEYEEDGELGNTENTEDKAKDEDGKAEEETSNNKDEDSESSEESEEEKDKGHKHWFSRHNKHKHLSSNGEQVDSKTKKVTNKVHKMVRAQVLKKASNIAGSDVKDDEGGALARKVGSLMRDATIRKVAPQLFSKPLHGAVNLLKTHFDTMDNEKRGTMATRDLDTFYERALARDLGFRVADRVINTVSTVVGGALAAGTIHQLHKKSHDDVNQLVEELGAENLAELAEELNEEDHKIHTANEARSLHSINEVHKNKKEHKQKKEHEKKGHFWAKSKHDKGELEKRGKHHKKDVHEKKNKHHLWSSSKNKHKKEVSDEDDDYDDEEDYEKEHQQPHTHHNRLDHSVRTGNNVDKKG